MAYDQMTADLIRENDELRTRIAALEEQVNRFQLIGFTVASRVEDWLKWRSPANLPLMAYHGAHRVAVFTLVDGVELAGRGASPEFAGTMREQEFGDVLRRPGAPTLPVVLAGAQQSCVVEATKRDAL